MIIRIEDAPHIKHIKIDINFDDDNTPTVEITNNSAGLNTPTVNTTTETPKKSMMDDIALDTNETFEISEEVVEKPIIPDTDRVVKVSDDMENAEF